MIVNIVIVHGDPESLAVHVIKGSKVSLYVLTISKVIFRKRRIILFINFPHPSVEMRFSLPAIALTLLSVQVAAAPVAS